MRKEIRKFSADQGVVCEVHKALLLPRLLDFTFLSPLLPLQLNQAKAFRRSRFEKNFTFWKRIAPATLLSRVRRKKQQWTPSLFTAHFPGGSRPLL